MDVASSSPELGSVHRVEKRNLPGQEVFVLKKYMKTIS